MLKDYESAENSQAAVGSHLRDEDFIRLIKNKSTAAGSNNNSEVYDDIAPLRRHLTGCDSCLDQFKDFYTFFAPAEAGEAVAQKREIDAAWQNFAPRIIEQKTKTKFWARLFLGESNSNYFNTLGWAFAALLLLFTGFAAFVAWQAKNENSQLAEQFEKQKQASEERLKTIEQAVQNKDLAEQEKSRSALEKAELQKQVAALQTEVEIAKQQKQNRVETTLPPKPQNTTAEKPDNSLVAVNTPIYDVFPSDAVVRSGNQSANKLVVPNAAKNVVLILNAAGRADFPVYEASLLNNSGNTVWRGGGLRKDSTGNFTLTIARTALKSGNYRVKLSSGSQSVAEYSIIVEIGK